jgi:hypothetical protein
MTNNFRICSVCNRLVAGNYCSHPTTETEKTNETTK